MASQLSFVYRFQEITVWKDQRTVRHSLRSTAQTVAIDEFIGQHHYVRIHAILIRKVNDRMRMRIGETPEKRHVQSSLTRLLVSNLSFWTQQLLNTKS